MQQYTVYLYLKIALHISGGISTHHQELISLHIQYLALVKSLLLPVVNVTGSSHVHDLARTDTYNTMHGPLNINCRDVFFKSKQE